MSRQPLQITTLSPLHIGSGAQPLKRNIDFVNFGRSIYVFDSSRIFEYLVEGAADEAALLDQLTQTVNLASFLKQPDFSQQPDLALYVLAGTAAVQELRPHLKDYAAQPYIPGSTLKGAIRTALLDAALLERDAPIEARRFGDRAKFAAQEIERDIAGRGERPWQAPNYDVFRSIQIADSAAVAPTCLTLSNVLVWPAGESGIPIDVETVAAGQVFQTSLRIDEYLFSGRAEKLGMAAKRGMIERLAETCRADAAARIEAERAYFAERNERTLQRFYDGLAARLEAAGPDTWLMQIGWGAGWNSKTIARTLRAHDQIPEVVKKYRLDRGKGRGGAFPATRHVIVDSRRQPVETLGWVEVRMGGI